MSKRKDVAILVSEKYRNNPYIDDVELKKALEKLKYSVDILAWDDKKINFKDYKVAIIRSCWDYDQRVDEFLDKMKKIEEDCLLINSYSLIKENSNKYYLETLKSKGVNIVPTLFIDNIEDFQIPFKSEYIIIKPTVSASGRNTYRVKGDNIDYIREICKEILEYKEVMLQPYISSIEKVGERSTVIIDGEPTFTMKKTPKKGEYLVHQYMGGTYTPIEPSQDDIKFVKQVESHLREKPLYIRIDYIYDESNKPMLLELEMIEPNIYLAQNNKGLKRIVDKLSEILS